MPAENESPVTKADLAALEQRLDTTLDRHFAAIEHYVAATKQELREYIDERTHDAETRLLRGFADYNASAGVRFRKMEADITNIDSSTALRLGELERQMTELKLRVIALEGQP